MSKAKLITFGCSWTFGVGAIWRHGMSMKEFYNLAWSKESEDCSFRTKLSKKYDLENINFAAGGASNAKNFRLAKEFFAGQDLTDATVLWGITATSRSEIWDSTTKHYMDLKYDLARSNGRHLEFSKLFLENIYDHDHEVELLRQEMLHWNDYFAYHNIKIIWFDSFNTHNYLSDIPNLIRPNDLLTAMLAHANISVEQHNKFYHSSRWNDDDPRISAAKKVQLVDPFTLHPGDRGHDIITDFLSPYIEERLNGTHE